MPSWRAILPTVYITSATASGTSKIPVDVVYNYSVSGTNSIITEYELDNTSAAINDITNVFVSAALDTADNDITDTFEVGTTTSYFTDITDTFFLGYKISTVEDIRTVFSELLSKHKYEDVKNFIRFYISALSKIENIDVDLFLSNDRRFNLDTSIFSTETLTPKYIGLELTTESGKVSKISTDLFSCDEDVLGIQGSLFSTASGIEGYISDIETILGTYKKIRSDVWSTNMSTSGTIGCDVRTWSLEFGDFFLDVERYTTASATAWVDIVDYMYDIDTSGSYFKVNNQQVAVSFSDIAYGKRMYYNPPDDFDSKGDLIYTAHAVNSAGDVREKSFYLLYGYDVRFDSLVDWGANKTVSVWARAKNLGFCPEEQTAAFYFTTRDLEATNLGAIIRPVVSQDLAATIYPQSTYFFYGSTYKVTLEGVKDFAGNEMGPFEFEFVIEDPND